MREIPQPTIERLVIYYRYLEKEAAAGEYDVISSKKLGNSLGVTAAQVRKDLSYFGDFGCKGVGYEVRSLKKRLEFILGFDRCWPVVLVGAGNLGRALINYQGFKKMGLKITAVFDCDLDKIDNRVGGLKVQSIKHLEEIIREEKLGIAIIAVPAEEAEEVASRLVKSGIKAIWNFSPVSLKVPEDVSVKCVDLASSVGSLIYSYKQNDYLYQNRKA